MPYIYYLYYNELKLGHKIWPKNVSCIFFIFLFCYKNSDKKGFGVIYNIKWLLQIYIIKF
jgi:hypothetical protein